MTAEFFSQVKLDDTEAKGSYGIPSAMPLTH